MQAGLQGETIDYLKYQFETLKVTEINYEGQ